MDCAVCRSQADSSATSTTAFLDQRTVPVTPAVKVKNPGSRELGKSKLQGCPKAEVLTGAPLSPNQCPLLSSLIVLIRPMAMVDTNQTCQVALVVKNLPASVGGCNRQGFCPWIGKIPWRRAWQPTPVFLPGESHGQRSLAGYGL